MYCESKMIAKNNDEIDVGCGNAFGGESAEDAGGPSGVEMVNNVMEAFQYTETQIGTASDFKSWIKDYMNAVVLAMREKKIEKEKIQAFKASAPGIAKFFLTQFSDVQFYIGASFCADSMVFSIYPEGGLTPNFYYIMAGMAAMKF